MSGWKYDFFLCHAGKDAADFVSDLKKQLTLSSSRRGVAIRIFLDKDGQQSLKLGSVIEEEIEKAITQTRFCILVLSEKVLEKECYAQQEVQHFMEVGRNADYGEIVIPIFYKLRPEECQILWNTVGIVYQPESGIVAEKNETLEEFTQRTASLLIENLIVEHSRATSWMRTQDRLRNSKRPQIPLYYIRRMKEYENLLRNLLHKQKGIISMTGSTGSGKTSLAVDITRRSEIIQHFSEVVMWVYSQNCSLDDIIRQLALQYEPITKMMLMKERNTIPSIESTDKLIEWICDRFNDLRHPIFVVFDDVSVNSPLLKLIHSLSEKVVILTTSQDFFTECNVTLGAMTDKDSKNLLGQYLGQEKKTEFFCREESVKALKLCEGLPIALSAMGSMLRTSLWNDVEMHFYNSLNSISTPSDGDSKVTQMLGTVIEVSFERLDRVMQESALDLLVFFDYKAIPFDLVQRWWKKKSQNIEPIDVLSRLLHRGIISLLATDLNNNNIHSKRIREEQYNNEDIPIVLELERNYRLAVHDIHYLFLKQRLSVNEIAHRHSSFLSCCFRFNRDKSKIGSDPWWEHYLKASYFCNNVIKHLIEAGFIFDSLDILFSFQWLQRMAKFDLLEVIQLCCTYAMQHLPSQLNNNNNQLILEQIDILSQCIKQVSQAVNRDPRTSLLSQMIGRLTFAPIHLPDQLYLVAMLSSAMKRAELKGSYWLLPFNQNLHSPGEPHTGRAVNWRGEGSVVLCEIKNLLIAPGQDSESIILIHLVSKQRDIYPNDSDRYGRVLSLLLHSSSSTLIICHQSHIRYCKLLESAKVSSLYPPIELQKDYILTDIRASVCLCRNDAISWVSETRKAVFILPLLLDSFNTATVPLRITSDYPIRSVYCPPVLKNCLVVCSDWGIRFSEIIIIQIPSCDILKTKLDEVSFTALKGGLHSDFPTRSWLIAERQIEYMDIIQSDSFHKRTLIIVCATPNHICVWKLHNDTPRCIHRVTIISKVIQLSTVGLKDRSFITLHANGALRKWKQVTTETNSKQLSFTEQLEDSLVNSFTFSCKLDMLAIGRSSPSQAISFKAFSRYFSMNVERSRFGQLQQWRFIVAAAQKSNYILDTNADNFNHVNRRSVSADYRGFVHYILNSISIGTRLSDVNISLRKNCILLNRFDKASSELLCINGDTLTIDSVAMAPLYNILTNHFNTIAISDQGTICFVLPRVPSTLYFYSSTQSHVDCQSISVGAVSVSLWITGVEFINNEMVIATCYSIKNTNCNNPQNSKINNNNNNNNNNDSKNDIVENWLLHAKISSNFSSIKEEFIPVLLDSSNDRIVKMSTRLDHTNKRVVICCLSSLGEVIIFSLKEFSSEESFNASDHFTELYSLPPSALRTNIEQILCPLEDVFVALNVEKREISFWNFATQERLLHYTTDRNIKYIKAYDNLLILLDRDGNVFLCNTMSGLNIHYTHY